MHNTSTRRADLRDFRVFAGFCRVRMIGLSRFAGHSATCAASSSAIIKRGSEGRTSSSLPKRVNGPPQVPVVHRVHRGVEGTDVEPGVDQGCGIRIRLRLTDVARTGDDSRHARLRGDPREGRCGQRDTLGEDCGEFGCRGQPDLVVDTRERLAAIERLTVPVIAAVVVLGERGRGGVLARQQPRGERNARENRDAGLLGRGRRLVEGQTGGTG